MPQQLYRQAKRTKSTLMGKKRRSKKHGRSARVMQKISGGMAGGMTVEEEEPVVPRQMHDMREDEVFVMEAPPLEVDDDLAHGANGEATGEAAAEVDALLANENERELAHLQVDQYDDAQSVFAPSRYPAANRDHRVERPFDSATFSSSKSIFDDIDYHTENGRRYCGAYYMPNDDEEQLRLQLVHQVYLHLFDLELTSVPLENPTYILDVGTGTGEWAIGMGELYPDCEVVGMDISPIQSSQVPRNVFFECDNAELDWARPADSMDLIHFRHMSGAFSDWDFIYRQSFHCLKPGGWIEILDHDDHRGMGNFISHFPPGSQIHQFANDLQEASELSGRHRGIRHLEPRKLMEAGFVDIKLQELDVPMGSSENSCAKLWLVACLVGFEAIALRLLTNYKAWSADRVRAACANLQEELKALAVNPGKAKGFVVKIWMLTARKPTDGGSWMSGAHQSLVSLHGSGETPFTGGDASTVGSGS